MPWERREARPLRRCTVPPAGAPVRACRAPWLPMDAAASAHSALFARSGISGIVRGLHAAVHSRPDGIGHDSGVSATRRRWIARGAVPGALQSVAGNPSRSCAPARGLSAGHVVSATMRLEPMLYGASQWAEWVGHGSEAVLRRHLPRLPGTLYHGAHFDRAVGHRPPFATGHNHPLALSCSAGVRYACTVPPPASALAPTTRANGRTVGPACAVGCQPRRWRKPSRRL